MDLEGLTRNFIWNNIYVSNNISQIHVKQLDWTYYPINIFFYNLNNLLPCNTVIIST